MSTNPTLIDLADAVVTLINAGNIGAQEHDPPEPPTSAFTAQRKVLPLVEFDTVKATDPMTVHVVPGGFATELTSRGASRIDERIVDVAFLKKLRPNEARDCDMQVPPLLALVEGVIDYLLTSANRRVAGHTLMTLTQDPVFAPQLLRENQLFVSIVRLTYKQGAG